MLICVFMLKKQLCYKGWKMSDSSIIGSLTSHLNLTALKSIYIHVYLDHQYGKIGHLNRLLNYLTVKSSVYQLKARTCVLFGLWYILGSLVSGKPNSLKTQVSVGKSDRIRFCSFCDHMIVLVYWSKVCLDDLLVAIWSVFNSWRINYHLQNHWIVECSFSKFL